MGVWLFRLVLSAVVIIAQFVLSNMSYRNGEEHERTRWRTWLADRRIPRQHFLINGAYQPEPPTDDAFGWAKEQ